MKLLDVILFSMAVVLFVIGIHQSMTVGIAESYFIFMFSIGFLLLYSYRKGKQKQEKK